MSIKINQLSYAYQPNSPFASQALFDINLTIEKEQFVALIGHTGSGKSTLIQHINGLLVPEEGTVFIDDFEINSESKQKDIHPIRRKVGLVFQFPEAQLFEETVLKDVAFGPQNFGVPEEAALATAREKLAIVGLDPEFFERSPFELSGGQMRRVAIAGILAMEPEILILDEPTAGLDPKSRVDMMDLFAELHRKQHLTVILVTHNMDDVANYTDFVYILEQGHLIKSGQPSDIFQEVDFIYEHGLGLPRATEFALMLKNKGLSFARLPITKTELLNQLLVLKGIHNG